MTRTGWKCPVCGRGVSPDEKTCPCSGGEFKSYPPVFVPSYWPAAVPYVGPVGGTPPAWPDGRRTYYVGRSSSFGTQF